MADFCFQCSIDMFFSPPGDLDGLCEPGMYVVVICEGCGVVQVDHRGWCVSPDCVERHGIPGSRSEVYERAIRQWERRSGPLGAAYRLLDRFFGSPWEPGIWSDYSIPHVRFLRSFISGTPMYMFEPQFFEFGWPEFNHPNCRCVIAHALETCPDGEEPVAAGVEAPIRPDGGAQAPGVVRDEDLGPLQGGET